MRDVEVINRVYVPVRGAVDARARARPAIRRRACHAHCRARPLALGQVAHRSYRYMRVGTGGMLAGLVMFIIMGIIGGTAEVRSAVLPLCLAVFVSGRRRGGVRPCRARAGGEPPLSLLLPLSSHCS